MEMDLDLEDLFISEEEIRERKTKSPLILDPEYHSDINKCFRELTKSVGISNYDLDSCERYIELNCFEV